ncbi:hypothetical protein NW754_016485 [Fusarium falciforme]|nr:hypothetical protein NW754_016485 [Fusarium falciforme]
MHGTTARMILMPLLAWACMIQGDNMEVARVAKATATATTWASATAFFLYTTTTNNERPAGYGVIEQGLWLAYYTRDLGTCLHTNILDEGAWIEDIGVHTLWLTSFGRFLLFLGSRGSFGGQVDSCRSMTDDWKKKGLGLAGSGMSSLYGIVSPPLLFVAKDLRNLYEYIPQRG